MRKIACFVTNTIIFLACFCIISPVAAQWSTVGGNVSSNNTYAANYCFTIDSSGTLYTAFADLGNQYIVTVKKLAGGTWVNIGTPGFITGTGASSGLFYNPGTSIAINPLDNSLYIALSDGDHNNKVSVMRFNGTAWVYVGTPGFSTPSACGVKLAFTNAGVPYVAFSSCYDNSEISVMYFSGSWQYAGLQGFATGNYVQLVAAPGNSVSIAFRDAANNNKLSVMGLAGNVWSYTGTPGFSDGEADNIALTADAANKLYVAYCDYSNNSKITVKSTTGGTWTTVGDPSFSSFAARFTDINISRDGTPYVSYVDIFPVVKKLYNGAWIAAGNYVATTQCLHTSLVNDSLGNPYVLTALQPSSATLPIVYKYSPCNDTTYHFVVTAVLDSALSSAGATTTIRIMATGGIAPYAGTGTFTISSGGDYTYTVTDKNGCNKSVTITVAYPPCADNYWTGSSSTNWQDIANWSCGAVPGSTTIVHISAGSTFYPIIHSLVICKSVITEPGTAITVATGGELRVMQ